MAWKFRVVKRMRGMRGEYLDFPTAATFEREDDAREYAERFARDQGAAGVPGARIDVRARKGGSTVATFKSEAYIGASGHAAAEIA